MSAGQAFGKVLLRIRTNRRNPRDLDDPPNLHTEHRSSHLWWRSWRTVPRPHVRRTPCIYRRHRWSRNLTSSSCLRRTNHAHSRGNPPVSSLASSVIREHRDNDSACSLSLLLGHSLIDRGTCLLGQTLSSTILDTRWKSPRV